MWHLGFILISIGLIASLLGCDNEYNNLFPGEGEGPYRLNMVVYRHIIPYHEIWNAIITQVAINEENIRLSDKKYLEYYLDELEAFLIIDDTDLMEYIPEYRDCDNKAIRLMGNVTYHFPGIPFGIIWIHWIENGERKDHAINIFYNRTDKQIYLIYPEYDAIIPADYRYYSDLILLNRFVEDNHFGL